MHLTFFGLALLTIICSVAAEPAQPQPGAFFTPTKRAKASSDTCAYLNQNDAQLGQLNGVFCLKGVKDYVNYKYPNDTNKRKKVLRDRLTQLIQSNGQTCTYPQNATPQPQQDNVCFFTCSKGYTANQNTRTCDCTGNGRIDCGGRCVKATACVSGVPVKRELFNRENTDCPPSLGFYVCRGQSGQKDCVNTKMNLNNCGGCVDPVNDDAARGRDCTLIEGADEVSCENGRCYIGSCSRGYHVSANGTLCERDLKREDVVLTGRDL